MAERVEVQLYIDGARFERYVVDLLSQSSAFPGGHRYEIRLRGDDVTNRYFEGILTRGTHERVREQKAWIFLRIGDLVSIGGLPMGDIEFFCNTIDEAIVSDDQIIVRGECSRVTQRTDQTKENGKETKNENNEKDRHHS